MVSFSGLRLNLGKYQVSYLHGEIWRTFNFLLQELIYIISSLTFVGGCVGHLGSMSHLVSPLISSPCCYELTEGMVFVYCLFSLWASLPQLGLLKELVQTSASHLTLKRFVAGKSQSLLHGGRFLRLAFCCLCYYNQSCRMACLRESCPSAS